VKIERSKIGETKPCAGCGKEISPASYVEVVEGRLFYHADTGLYCLTPPEKAQLLKIIELK